MLKKTLIAVAILAMVAPAFAADVEKLHGWSKTVTTTYHWEPITNINVCLDVGYWISIDAKGKCIEVHQDSMGGTADPFKTYSGCHPTGVEVKSNFAATLKATAAASSAAAGSWTATIGGGETATVGANSTTTLAVCVVGTDVKIQNLTVDPTDSSKETVAVVTISVLPTEYAP